MKNTYYPDKNTLVIEHEGKMIGFRGGIAERILKRFIDKGVPVAIGTLRKSVPLSNCAAKVSNN